MTRIVLVRHAQSTWNHEGRWQGRADPPLSEEGMRSAAGAGAALAAGRLGVVPDAVVSSDQRRAQQTASALADPIGRAPVCTYEGLRERDVGAFTGLTRAEIEQRWPGILPAARGPVDPPGGETAAALVQRALAAVHAIAGRYRGATVLVVTHGALISAVERHLGFDRVGPPRHLSGRWLELDGSDVRAGQAIALLDDARART